MIPKEKKLEGLDPKEAFTVFANISESNEVRYRKERREHPLKFVHKYKKGLCTLCKSTDKRILSEKHRLCKTCRDWCKRWLIRNYGVYKKQFMGDAIVAAVEPVPCKFYKKCGNMIPNMKDGKFLRLRICDDCYPIWANGVKAGRSKKVILRRY